MNGTMLALILAVAATFLGGVAAYAVLRLIGAIDLSINGTVMIQVDAIILGLALAGLVSALFLQLFLSIASSARKKGLQALEQKIDARLRALESRSTASVAPYAAPPASASAAPLSSASSLS